MGSEAVEEDDDEGVVEVVVEGRVAVDKRGAVETSRVSMVDREEEIISPLVGKEAIVCEFSNREAVGKYNDVGDVSNTKEKDENKSSSTLMSSSFSSSPSPSGKWVSSDSVFKEVVVDKGVSNDFLRGVPFFFFLDLDGLVGGEIVEVGGGDNVGTFSATVFRRFVDFCGLLESVAK